MEKVYLENARQTFLRPPRESVYYEGRNLDQFDSFIKMLGYVVPNKLTPEELIVYLEFLVNDIKDGVCRFQNSKAFKDAFKSYMYDAGNLEMWMTYFPSFAKAVTPKEFYEEFIHLFRKSFYQLESQEEKNTDYGYIEVEKDVIDISNKNKADVLAALYNHAKPVGMGIVQYDPTPMTREIAEYVISKMGYYFDYLKGRPIKCNMEDNIIYVGSYNRDNDYDGLAQKAISTCPNINKDITKKYTL